MQWSHFLQHLKELTHYWNLFGFTFAFPAVKSLPGQKVCHFFFNVDVDYHTVRCLHTHQTEYTITSWFICTLCFHMMNVGHASFSSAVGLHREKYLSRLGSLWNKMQTGCGERKHLQGWWSVTGVWMDGAGRWMEGSLSLAAKCSSVFDQQISHICLSVCLSVCLFSAEQVICNWLFSKLFL